MRKIIFHGSDHVIEKPVYGEGSLNNDYGRGFYCTENIELAKEWACGKGHNGYANKYELDMDGLRVINLNLEGHSILNWLAVLTKYRTYWQNSSVSAEAKDYLQKNFYIDLSDYDVVIGYRADDSYFTFAQDFVSNVISLGKLKRAMYLGELGEQIVLRSEEDFVRIRYLGSEEADVDIYYPRKNARDLSARKAYRDEKPGVSDLNDIFMLDIMREGMLNGDPRLQ